MLKAGGAIAVVLLLAGLYAWGPSLDTKTPGKGDADQQVDPMSAMIATCREAKPIDDAAPFEATPGRHRLEGVILWKDGLPNAGEPERYGLPEGWNSPEADGAVKIDELQLVACYTATATEVDKVCPMETEAGEPVDVEMWKTGGTLVIREAKTGKEVLRKAIAAERMVCYGMLFDSTGRVIEHPTQSINALLDLYNDGTEPGLPVREQIAQLCAGELDRVVLPKARPTDAVTVVSGPADGEAEPLTQDSPYVLPPEVNVVPPEEAGTVLCITEHAAQGTYGVDATMGIARTLATGDVGQGVMLASGDDPARVLDDEGRHVLPWVAPEGHDLRTALTTARQQPS